MISVKFVVTNTGKVAGTEVERFFPVEQNLTRPSEQIPQLYLTMPPSANSPPKLLKGFDSVFLTPRKSQAVIIQLSRYDLSVWNVVQQRWTIPSGSIGISIGASSRDIRLKGSVSV